MVALLIVLLVLALLFGGVGFAAHAFWVVAVVVLVAAGVLYLTGATRR
jgi:hypothetical protein